MCTQLCTKSKEIRLKSIIYMGLFVKNGAPGEIRTPDQVVRSHLLYPAELRVRSTKFKLAKVTISIASMKFYQIDYLSKIFSNTSLSLLPK